MRDQAVTSSLHDRVALVTGAATGLGLGIAQALARHGVRLVLNDIDEAALSAARRSINGEPVLVVADVGATEDVERLVATAEAESGGLDILVNNAGIQVVKPLVEHTIEEWDRIIAVNLRGVFLTMRTALPAMMDRRRGAIINLASIAAFHTTTPHVAYSASKAAVVALTRDAAYEAAPFGVRVNALAPGPIATPMTERIDPVIRDEISAAIPVGRWGDPADVGAAVVFLASEEASFITGATLPIAGGANLKLAY